MSSAVIIFIATILFISIIYAYSFIKVGRMNKGKILKNNKPNLSKLRYESFIVITLGIALILYYKNIIPIWLPVILIISDITYKLLGRYSFQKPPIKVYEKGIVLGDIAFYTWDELNIHKEGGRVKIKIKYIPKEIVLDKNVLRGVNYERN